MYYTILCYYISANFLGSSHWVVKNVGIVEMCPVGNSAVIFAVSESI